MEKKIERMLDRWSGVKGPPRPPRQRTEVLKTRDEGANGVGAGDKDEENCEGDRVEVLQNVVLEAPRQVPILARCDVLVVGSGPSGLSAALAARRAGAKEVVLCERFGCFGGVITTVGMETLGWYRYEGCMNDSEGIGMEMERLAAQMGGTIKWPYNDSPCLDADFFKIVADHLIKSSGVRPILHCLAVEAIMEGNVIKGILTESKSGRQAILAERVIDCTGDADIAFLAGAQYKQTSKEEAMGLTTVFNCAGVKKEDFLKYTEKNPATYRDWSRTWDQETTGKEDSLRSPYLDTEFEKAREIGAIPANTSNLGGSWSALSEAGEATNLNLAHMSGYDATNVEDLTKAEMEGREQALYALKALKKVVPGFEKAKLRNFGMTIGVRDTRKIVGRYNLTGDDVRNQARFKDSVGIFPEFIDGYNILILPTTGRYFEIPYGCLLPVNVENLLVGGRCVAGDMTSHAAMRNMMACTVSGQAAGAAAAVSLANGESAAQVNMEALQRELEKQGVRIH